LSDYFGVPHIHHEHVHTGLLWLVPQRTSSNIVFGICADVKLAQRLDSDG